MTRLHLGSGKAYMDGWTNVDIFSTVQADMYFDITRLPFDPRSFDLIYACHVLEHVHRHMIVATLSHWWTILTKGGVLRLAVPSFEAVVKHYNEHGDLKVLTGLLYGGQNHPKNNHFIVFDTKTLTDCLLKAGFRDVRTWDWRETDHKQYDDFSQCYLPHMDNEHGQLMSLNLEAVK